MSVVAIITSGFVQTVKTVFQDLPGLAKTKFQGFQGCTKLVFRLSRINSVHKYGCIRSKKCTYQISYSCNCITGSVSEIHIDPKGNKLHTVFNNEFLL